jgi:drug/metabolite transporter (DMT)-like permease
MPPLKNLWAIHLARDNEGETLDAYLGEVAGLVTSFMYSLSSTFFTLAGRKVSSFVLNRVRLILAILLIILAHFLLRTPLPFRIEGDRLFWLGLSGVIGLTIGDIFLFEGYNKIGPRLTMLMMSLAPVLSAILAALFLAERLSAGQVVGILVTVGGIAWVISDKNGSPQRNGMDQKKYIEGILFGLGAATSQALGLITAKRGLGGGFPAISATLVRMVAGALALWAVTLIIGQARATLVQIVQERQSAIFILLGAVAGPLFGVTLSMYALQHTEVGIASTLMALPPVLLLPIGYFAFNERFGWQAIFGTMVAMGGVALLFLV